MDLLNLNTLVKVEVFDKRHCHYYEWRSEKSWLFGLFKRRAGFYYSYAISEFSYDLERAKKQYIVENDLLYDKPCIKLRFANPSCDITEEFDTFEQANARGEEIKKLAVNSIWLKH